MDIYSMLEKEYSQIFAARPLCTSGIQTVFRRVGQHDRETIYIDDIIRLFHHFLRRTLTMYTLTHDTIISGVIVIQYVRGAIHADASYDISTIGDVTSPHHGQYPVWIPGQQI